MASPATGTLADKSGARVDLALTLPVFLAYHLGVVFLKVKNGTDMVTGPLLELANGSRESYLGLTLAIGALFAAFFAFAGKGQAFRLAKFGQIALEGVVYAVAMRFGADYVVGRMSIALAPAAPASPLAHPDVLTGVVMSMGAGFYEEVAFRAILFGLGAKALVWLFARQQVGLVERSSRLSFKAVLIMFVWALVSAAVFSGVHYIGVYGDPFQLGSFVFRMVLGLALTLIFVTRGFAAAVWTHAFYDIWVLVF
jgi:Type II CAAX prenyl endopeptidase Rce1-like